LYSQHLIFFKTYELAKLPRVLHYSKLERLVSNKRFSLLGPFISYEVLPIRPLNVNYTNQYTISKPVYNFTLA